MFNIKTLIAAVLATAAIAPALAQVHSTPRIDQRQENQQARIEQGVRSGELTRNEAHQLQHQQAHIAATERRAAADGVVTPKEKRKIEHMQDNASNNINKKKHNNKKRPPKKKHHNHHEHAHNKHSHH